MSEKETASVEIDDEEISEDPEDISEEELEEMDESEEEVEDVLADQVIENITTIKQPVTLEVEVGAETGAKGEVKPFVKAKITRHMEIDAETSTEVYDMVGQDFCELSEQIKIIIDDMKSNLNKGKPEMQ